MPAGADWMAVAGSGIGVRDWRRPCCDMWYMVVYYDTIIRVYGEWCGVREQCLRFAYNKNASWPLCYCCFRIEARRRDGGWAGGQVVGVVDDGLGDVVTDTLSPSVTSLMH